MYLYNLLIAIVFLNIAAFAPNCVAQSAAASKADNMAPIVVELPDKLNSRAEELLRERQDMMEQLRESLSAASAEVKELLSINQGFNDEFVDSPSAKDLAAAVRKLAQSQILRHELCGRRNVLMVATGASPYEGFTFVENSQWNATILSALGDHEGAQAMAGYGCFDPVIAKLGGLLLRSDAEEQERLIQKLREELSESPFDEIVADKAILIVKRQLGSDTDRQQLFSMMEQLGPGCSPSVRMLVRMMQAKQKFDRTQKLVGTKDFMIKGLLADGTPFDSSSLDGKVVIVDFWATWCGPCVAELPRLAGLLEKHKDEGLAIVGVNNDYDVRALTSFIARRPDVTWTQLFDPTSAANFQNHHLTRDSGIQGLPALFVIDRQGVLRSVTARETLEEVVAELLKEPSEGKVK